MQGNQAKIKQIPRQSKQDLVKCKATNPKLNRSLAKVNKTWAKCRATKPKLNKPLAKVNKTWAKCKANQAKIKQGPSQSKQILGYMQGKPRQH